TADCHYLLCAGGGGAHPSPYKKQPKSQVKLINDSEAISNATYPALPRKQKVQWRLSGNLR
ncbi:hypothetical protein, partial [Salmonella sp. 741265087_PSA]|uniref:hypothetical protein n=1 Tax=Salmonella sp. 741265087_PSA TaxID=3389010 RepID=UPI00397F222E